jgi:hypothetical protein
MVIESICRVGVGDADDVVWVGVADDVDVGALVLDDVEPLAGVVEFVGLPGLLVGVAEDCEGDALGV